MFRLKRLAIFAGGVLFGTAGVKLLGSKDAKKVYANGVAVAIRAKDSVMKTATAIQENTEDIVAEAIQINVERQIKEHRVYEPRVETDEQVKSDEASSESQV